MLSSIKRTNFPSSLTETTQSNITEEIKTYDNKRKITRDVEKTIVISSNYFKFVLFILPIIPLALTYLYYIKYGPNSTTDPLSPWVLLGDLLYTLNYMGIVYFLFFALRVKDPQVNPQQEKLSGVPVFFSPRFLENIVSHLKASYIKQEQVSFYRKMRTALMLVGFIPIVSALVFFFI